MRRSNFALRLQPSLLEELRKAAELEGVVIRTHKRRGIEAVSVGVVVNTDVVARNMANRNDAGGSGLGRIGY